MCMHYAYTAIFSKIFLKEKQREEDVEGSKKILLNCYTIRLLSECLCRVVCFGDVFIVVAVVAVGVVVVTCSLVEEAGICKVNKV